MGPPQAEDALRDAISRGCDDAYHVTDRAFAGVDLEGALDARKFIGRAPEQVDAFVRDVVDPILARHRADLDVTRGDVRV